MMQYLVFLTVILSIKFYLDRKRKSAAKKEVLPDDVCKKSYRYWDKGGEYHSCNIYSPEGRNSAELPLIIDIHGGCWVHGDKDVNDLFNCDLVRQGNVVTTLTYRTAEKAVLADQIRDVFQYMHFLEERSKELEISLDQVMLTGDSAGAELSLIVYCINQSRKLQEVFHVEPFGFDVKCMVLTHPVCFIDQAGSIPQSRFLSKYFGIPGLQRFLYGKNYKNNPEYQVSANPKWFVTDEMTFPPILLVTSAGDSTYKYQTFLLADFLDSKEIDYRIYYEKDEDAEHVFNISRPFSETAEKCNRFILDFFRLSLRMPELN